MSKEIMLLELVLDNFSNIKKVLNATSDIEHFLSKLKLNEKVKEGSEILKKTKNLVDSIYDHSLKLKDEFYKHYGKHEDVPAGKKVDKENESIIEENAENNEDTVQENRESVDSTVEENKDDNDNGIQENIDADKTVEENNGVDSSPHVEPVNTQDSESNESIINDENSELLVDNENQESEVDQSDGSTSTKSRDVNNTESDIDDNEADNVTECNADNTEATTNKGDADSNLENEADNLIECNDTEKEEEAHSDNDTEETNCSELISPSNDPLDVERDIIDSSNLKDSNSRKDTDKEKESATEDKDNSFEDTLEIKREPRIRLVDLSKLMDPKPKKSVKFDSSVIILTSSDEECKTSKRRSDTKDQNANENVTLKSALKISHKKRSSDEERIRKKKDEKWSKNKKSRRDYSDSEECEVNSSDAESKIVEVLSKKDKEKVLIRITNKKSKSEKKIHSISSNNRETDAKSKSKNDKVAKSKQSRIDKENSSDSEKSEDDPTKKKKKALKDKEDKEKVYSSDSSDCIIQDGSESENRNNNESLENNSRRSSRLHRMQDQKQKRKERLRSIFRRKLSTSSRSSANISKKYKDESDSDSDADSTRKTISSQKRKIKKIEHLSDTSSLSDDENEEVELKERSKKSKKRKRKDMPVDAYNKFTCKVYIPLLRIECERLKEVYLHNKEILEIKSLRKINLSKSSKRSHKSKNDSKSSSDAEKPKTKKSKNNSPTNSASNDDQISDDDEPLKDLSKQSKKANEEAVEKQKPVENNDDKMAEIVMDELKDVDDEEKKAEESSSDSEEEKEKTENAQNKQKEAEKESEDKEDEQKDKLSDGENKKSEDEAKEETDKDEEKEESDDEKKKNKKKWRSDKLLTTKIDSTDSDEEFSKFSKKKEEKSREEIMRKTKKRANKAVVISDSEDSDKSKKKNSEDSSDKTDLSDGKPSSSSGSEKEDDEKKKKPARRRIKRTRGSSSSSEEDKSTRKQIRRLIGKDALSETTKQAEAEEKERKARIAEKQKKYNQIYEGIAESKVEKVVLDYDEKNKKELLAIDKRIVKKLKPHQASGVQFMWDACFESLERAKSTKGSGCILAHCMGLGKTLQVIALVHTLLTNSKKTGINKILVVCPVNTVLNWKAEFKKWLPKGSNIEIFELVSCKQNYERKYYVEGWHNDGGVLIIGYAMFRNLSNPDNKRISKKLRTVFGQGLVDPGPDLVVCDEGHLLKNEKTNLSIAMNRIKTYRRIVLTGTPLQNNLKEYWCMVQFIKPNLLGTYKEYLNRFVNPITNGQYTDSTQHDILLMRKRSHVLHKLLDGVVQRRDYGVLEPYLPPKHEYVLFIKLTETQIKMYTHYMDRFARQNGGSNRTSFLFNDFQQLQKICTHPRVMLDKTRERREKEFFDDEDSEGSLKDFIDDGDVTSNSSSGSSSSKSGSDSENSDGDKKEKKKPKKQQKVRVTRAQAAQRRENDEKSDSELEEITKEWWQEYCDGEELDNINNSGKLFLLFQILKECEEIGDKVLVFSQSLFTLNCIEYFLDKIDEATQTGNTEKVGGYSGSWSIGLDYFRLDGSSSCDNRAAWCDMFNNPNNTRARLFLISTKAGGLGINLVAANRVIIFDVSWNPSHDVQSIYRVYRFGQTKPCYIYRFVTYGAMEMKIYERQVTKQAISKRVIDEQQIDRHYNQNDLQELYRCDLEPTDRPIPLVPKDVLLGELLQKCDKTIFKYHLHQSLLENKEAEGLNEEERKAAWEEFENEKVLRKNTNITFFNNVISMNAQAIASALASIVRKDNPGWSDVQIKGIIPALVQQLQVQLAEGDLTMYTRVQQEMQIMQALQAQKLKEAYYQQQVMRMIQQQQQQAKLLGNMNVDPTQLARSQGSVLSSYLSGPSSAPPPQPLSNDVIELND